MKISQLRAALKYCMIYHNEVNNNLIFVQS